MVNKWPMNPPPPVAMPFNTGQLWTDTRLSLLWFHPVIFLQVYARNSIEDGVSRIWHLSIKLPGENFHSFYHIYLWQLVLWSLLVKPCILDESAGAILECWTLRGRFDVYLMQAIYIGALVPFLLIVAYYWLANASMGRSALGKCWEGGCMEPIGIYGTLMAPPPPLPFQPWPRMLCLMYLNSIKMSALGRHGLCPWEFTLIGERIGSAGFSFFFFLSVFLFFFFFITPFISVWRFLDFIHPFSHTWSWTELRQWNLVTFVHSNSKVSWLSKLAAICISCSVHGDSIHLGVSIPDLSTLWCHSVTLICGTSYSRVQW